MDSTNVVMFYTQNFLAAASLGAVTTAIGLGKNALNGPLADPGGGFDYRVTHSIPGGTNHRLTNII